MTHEERPTRPTRRTKAQAKKEKRQQVLERETERLMSGRYSRQRPRRVLAVVGLSFLGLLWVDAAVSWILAPSNTAMITNFVVLGILLVIGLPLAGQLVAVTRGMTFKDESELDEWELTGRSRAFTTAHRCTTIMMILVLLVTTAVDRDGEASQIPGAALFLILFALLITHFLLPLVVATWQIPDPPAEEDEFMDADTVDAR